MITYRATLDVPAERTPIGRAADLVGSAMSPPFCDRSERRGVRRPLRLDSSISRPVSATGLSSLSGTVSPWPPTEPRRSFRPSCA